MSRIDDRLQAVRAGLDRVRPEDLADEVDASAVVVDIRPDRFRAAEGGIPGAHVLERNVLEWRLDPTSPDRLDAAVDDAVRWIVVCNEGYASSLAAVELHAIGLHRATDLVGGYRAWRALVGAAATADGAPTAPPRLPAAT